MEANSLCYAIFARPKHVESALSVEGVFAKLMEMFRVMKEVH